MSEPFLGEIRMVGFSFAPAGWAFCNGQLMPISQNVALFSLLGVAYGGDGSTTFALPDFRGRAPIHQGQGPGLTNRTIGQAGGNEATALPAQQTKISHTPVNPVPITYAPGGQQINNMQPFLTVSFIIALQGLFPTQ